MSASLLPRLRMFAGPNGSGKSTIKSFVSEVIGEESFGFYINPDEIEKTIAQSNILDFSNLNLVISDFEVLDYFHKSDWLKNVGLTAESARITAITLGTIFISEICF